MNQNDFEKRIAKKLDISDLKAKDLVNNFFKVFHEVSAEMDPGDKLILRGFGTLSKTRRGERMGRNPQTGAAVFIPSKVVLKFKISEKLQPAEGC